MAFKKKADKRQDCKLSLRKIFMNLDELDKYLDEIQINLEMIEKDSQHLKVSSSSPLKISRSSSIHKGDLEKERDVAALFKELKS